MTGLEAVQFRCLYNPSLTVPRKREGCDFLFDVSSPSCDWTDSSVTQVIRCAINPLTTITNLVDDELKTFRRNLGACTMKNDQNDDELHFNDLDLDGDEDDGNDNENNSHTNNGNEDFGMIETPSWVQG
ncbi:Hypothetical predicted protein [Olea europaea subsp. europaea]|uniref:Uncharacterized protein n=1 Tax=Olea europaea subsp. europaea TaxID=158383 RepID=A0A8S0US43_OLEEU|nr:Hypothetical predicted protein [Olea europaea subsp. europaea]